MTPKPNYGMALKRMSLFATILALAGHTFLNFEQSWAHVVLPVLTACGAELLLETIDARTTGRSVRYTGGWKRFGEFLLSSYLTGLSVHLLVYPAARVMPLIFATLAAIGSKWLLRIPTARGSRHVFNPSNIGIALTLTIFPSVGVSPPYQFTEGVTGLLDWIVPLVIVMIGSFLNAKLTRRMPLIAGWLGGFAAQGIIRSLIFGVPLLSVLMPMTGMAFMLYTLYMITDPATTPEEPRGQFAFGATVAMTYGLLNVLHVVYGLFYALTIVCGVRGLLLWNAARARATAAPPVQTAAAEGGRA